MKRYFLIILAVMATMLVACDEADMKKNNLVKLCNKVETMSQNDAANYLVKQGFTQYELDGMFYRGGSQIIALVYSPKMGEIGLVNSGAVEYLEDKDDAIDLFFEWEKTMTTGMNAVEYYAVIEGLSGEGAEFKGIPQSERAKFLKKAQKMAISQIGAQITEENGTKAYVVMEKENSGNYSVVYEKDIKYSTSRN